jgi:hypothetical protein
VLNSPLRGSAHAEDMRSLLAYGFCLFVEPLSVHGKTVTEPTIPKPSCSAHLYG